MKKTSLLLAATSILTFLSMSVSATPISFIYTGTGSGNIGGSAFSNSAFTITEQSETTNIQSCGATCNFIDSLFTSISIDGVGSFNFITGTRTFDNSGSVGFSRAGINGADLYNVFNVGPTYDLASAIGPVSGFASLLQWGNSAINTNGGVLSFLGGSTMGTFEARIASTSVPEPGSLALLAAGILGLGFTRRLSRK